jgi:hypothetical protein
MESWADHKQEITLKPTPANAELPRPALQYMQCRARLFTGLVYINNAINPKIR